MKILLQRVKSKKKIFSCHLEGHWRKYQDPEPDPLVRGMDMRIWIHTNMSRIRNTGVRIWIPLPIGLLIRVADSDPISCYQQTRRSHLIP
jgi:hypothetical protein